MARAQGAAGVRAAPCRITSIAQGYINIEQAFQYGGLLDSPIQLSSHFNTLNNRLCLYYSTDCKTEVLVSVAHARGIPMQLVFVWPICKLSRSTASIIDSFKVMNFFPTGFILIEATTGT